MTGRPLEPTQADRSRQRSSLQVRRLRQAVLVTDRPQAPHEEQPQAAPLRPLRRHFRQEARSEVRGWLFSRSWSMSIYRHLLTDFRQSSLRNIDEMNPFESD